MEEYAFDMVNLASVGFSAPLYAYKQQTQIEQLQKLAAKCIEKNWDSLKEHERTFLTKGDAPEAVLKLVVKSLVRQQTQEIIESILPETGIFGLENPAERLLLLANLEEQIHLLKENEKMKSGLHDWITKLTRYLNLPAEEKVSMDDIDELDRSKARQFTNFPRPHCSSQLQIDQILDILHRVKVLSFNVDSTEVGKDSATNLACTIEIQVRSPSKHTKELIKSLSRKGRSRDGGEVSARHAMAGKHAGTLQLTYIFSDEMPHYGDGITKINLLTGSDRYYGFPLFSMCTGYTPAGEDWTDTLQALKARLLDGAPGMKGDDDDNKEEGLSDPQFMTLLLLLFQGHTHGSYSVTDKSQFAGYFSNERHYDDYYD